MYCRIKNSWPFVTNIQKKEIIESNGKNSFGFSVQGVPKIVQNS